MSLVHCSVAVDAVLFCSWSMKKGFTVVQTWSMSEAWAVFAPGLLGVFFGQVKSSGFSFPYL